ncbi:MAG: conjugative transfer signal peptidase TraF [bacterium]|nr:conjugative transfer signal peptidase TraF [bacterium]
MGRRVRNRNPTPARRLWPLGLAAFGLLVTAKAHLAGVRFNWTASAPTGFYLERPLKLARGELVLLCLPPSVETLGRRRGYLPAGECHGRSSPALKRLVGLPGDTIALDESFLAVNGAVLLQAPIQEFDSSGRPLAHAPFGARVLPPGQVWVQGVNTARSWDSRYFGPIPIESLVASVRPLLAINPEHR